MRQPALIHTIPMELCRSTLILRIDRNSGRPYSKLLAPEQALAISTPAYASPTPAPRAPSRLKRGLLALLALVAGVFMLAWTDREFLNTMVSTSHAYGITATAQDNSRRRIQDIQLRAERHVAEGRLNGPGQEHAYADYLELTQLSAAREAQSVLDKLMLAYLEQGRARLAAGKIIEAHALYREISGLDAAHQAGDILLEEIADSLLGEVRAQLAAGRLFDTETSALARYGLMERLVPSLLQARQAHTELAAALRAKAARQMAARELTLPEHDNAALSYKALLQIVPADDEALKGIQQIVGSHVAKARFYLDGQNQARSQELLEQALKFFPENRQLQVLHKQVLALKGQAI